VTQFGAWVTNKPVAFQKHRFANSTEMQEGVLDAGDYKVAQHAGVANMSVDVAIGKAWIQIDTGTRNGLAFAFSDALDNPALAASDATNPRVDQIVLQYNDTSIPAGVGGDIPTVRVIGGVPTAGATLDNRNGAAALPNDCVRLADVLVPAASTSVVTANIRDRRPWARGFSWSTSAALSGSAGPVAINQFRAELSGAPVQVMLAAMGAQNGSGGAAADVQQIARLDGAAASFTCAGNIIQADEFFNNAVAYFSPGSTTMISDPPPAPSPVAGASSVASGSHLPDMLLTTRAGTNTLWGVRAYALREVVGQRANNT
jgi:hypothetical protein